MTYTSRVGRRPKPEEAKWKPHPIKFPPELWARLTALIPAYRRSRWIRGVVEREVKKLEAKQDRGPEEQQ